MVLALIRFVGPLFDPPLNKEHVINGHENKFSVRIKGFLDPYSNISTFEHIDCDTDYFSFREDKYCSVIKEILYKYYGYHFFGLDFDCNNKLNTVIYVKRVDKNF